jgi:hypothetical protein
MVIPAAFHEVAKVYPCSTRHNLSNYSGYYFRMNKLEANLTLFFAHREIRAAWMNECQRAHAGFRIHHEALRQLHANLLWFQ